MSTSGTYSFYVTRDDIVREALLNLKKIDGIDPIEAVIMNDCVRKLNLLCKQWMGTADFAPGLKVWTRRRGHLFLHSTQYQYTLGPTSVGWATSYSNTTTTAAVAAATTALPVSSISGVAVGDRVGVELDTGDLFWTTVSSLGSLTINLTDGAPSSSSSGNVVFTYTDTPQQPLLIEAAVLRDIRGSDTPLKIMLQKEYDFLPNKTSQNNYGDPTAIYYENQLGYSYLYTDVAGAQDVTKHIVLTFMEPVQDFVNSTDIPYYPQEWYRALCWGLAKECAPMFNSDWTPLMEDLFKTSLAISQKKDPENSAMFFNPGED